MAPLARALRQRGFRAVTLDARGCDVSREETTLHDLAAEVAAAIQELGPPAAVLGNAFGGRLARCVAADHPALVSGVVVVGAGGAIGPEPWAFDALQRFLDTTRPREERRAAAQDALFARGSSVPDWFLDDDRSAAIADAQIAAMAATPVADWWAGGSAPMLVIQGTEDRIAPPANGHHLARELGDRVQVIDLPGAGHAVLTERLGEVTEAIAGFLSGLR